MLGHVFRLLGLRGVHAEVWFADGPLCFSSEFLTRRQAALEARRAVCALGGISFEQMPGPEQHRCQE